MKPEVHEDIYRVAYESATSELIEISATFEQLRIRKDRIENLVSVLKTLVGVEEKPGVSNSQAGDKVDEQTQQSAAATRDAAEQPEGLLSDPFQRRIDHVLGIGAGTRDVRKYSRQF
jgi:hypothetical protein